MEVNALHNVGNHKELELTPLDNVPPELPPNRPIPGLFDPELSLQFLNFKFVKPTQRHSSNAKEIAQVV
jgi:hypothetical protein